MLEAVIEQENIGVKFSLDGMAGVEAIGSDADVGEGGADEDLRFIAGQGGGRVAGGFDDDRSCG